MRKLFESDVANTSRSIINALNESSREMNVSKDTFTKNLMNRQDIGEKEAEEQAKLYYADKSKKAPKRKGLKESGRTTRSGKEIKILKSEYVRSFEGIIPVKITVGGEPYYFNTEDMVYNSEEVDGNWIDFYNLFDEKDIESKGK